MTLGSNRRPAEGSRRRMRRQRRETVRCDGIFRCAALYRPEPCLNLLRQAAEAQRHWSGNPGQQAKATVTMSLCWAHMRLLERLLIASFADLTHTTGSKPSISLRIR